MKVPALVSKQGDSFVFEFEYGMVELNPVNGMYDLTLLAFQLGVPPKKEN